VAQPGQIIADRYRLEEPLGHGAMGKIWRAQHLGFNGSVALKFLDPAIADNPDTFNRFLLEAHAAAAVRSAHVVQILDCGIDGSAPYISMELLHGETLDKRLRARPLTVPELDKVMREVAEAVDNAHRLGVIHRDLKPTNIFIAREREREITKVLDFGIAKIIDPSLDRDSAALTSSGMLLGTPHYMSPEQARGSRGVDYRADLWALAVLAYECLTGQLPFQGGSMGDILVQICTEEAPTPSQLVDVPPGFDEWFRKGTRKEPAERFASAREMAGALSEILAASPERTIRTRGRHTAGAAEPATLRSEPGSPDENPGSSPPVVFPASVWLPRVHARWLSWALAVALLCGAVTVAVWPSPTVSSRLGGAVLPSIPSPSVSPAPAATPPAATPLAIAEALEPKSVPPPAAQGAGANAENRPAGTAAARPRSKPQRLAASAQETLKLAEPPAKSEPGKQLSTTVGQEHEDLDPFSERR
jgi:serine/threonine-protein kinase